MLIYEVEQGGFLRFSHGTKGILSGVRRCFLLPSVQVPWDSDPQLLIVAFLALKSRMDQGNIPIKINKIEGQDQISALLRQEKTRKIHRKLGEGPKSDVLKLRIPCLNYRGSLC